MFSIIISAVLLATGASNVAAAPQASGTLLPLPTICTIPTYGPFKLYATRTNLSPKAVYEVRLRADGTTLPITSTMVVNTNSSCTNCGVIPDYWQLKDMNLIPVDTSLPRGVSTINDKVPDHSELHFITSKDYLPSYPIYCAVQASEKALPVLSVHGSSTLFTMCAFTSVYPPQKQFAITYDRSNVQPVGESCYPVTLTMEPAATPL